jgi:DNA-binding Lrp family transcriptional regulator
MADGRLDELDRRIIASLRARPATSNRDLAELLSVSEATVAARIRALVEHRVITVIAQRDIRSLGFDILAFCYVSVAHRAVSDVAADLRAVEAVGSVSLFAGSPEIVIQINARDRSDLTRILIDEIGAIEGVGSVETSIVTETVKFRSDIGSW